MQGLNNTSDIYSFCIKVYEKFRNTGTEFTYTYSKIRNSYFSHIHINLLILISFNSLYIMATCTLYEKKLDDNFHLNSKLCTALNTE